MARDVLCDRQPERYPVRCSILAALCEKYPLKRHRLSSSAMFHCFYMDFLARHVTREQWARIRFLMLGREQPPGGQAGGKAGKESDDWVDTGISPEELEEFVDTLFESVLPETPVAETTAEASISPVKRNWTAVEDAKLLLNVAENGKRWRDTAGAMEGRSDDSCRQRYKRLTSPPSSDDDACPKAREARFAWTAAEDDVIRAGLQQGCGWTAISNSLQNRSPQAVRNRAYRLLGVDCCSVRRGA